MALSQDRVYRASDKLLRFRDELEEYLTGKERTLFNLQETVLLYDLTNTFFEGKGKYNSKAKFGRSKEKRYDCPLVTLGLVLDGEGFSKRSRVFEGNVSEPQTLEKILDGLNKQPSLLKPLVIMDAGIATEDNLKWLRENHYDYLAVSRRKKRQIPQEALSRMTAVKHDRQDQELVVAAVVNNADHQENEVWCHSVGKEMKEAGIHNLFRQRFEEELKKIESGLSKKYGTKLYQKVLERIGRLKERYSRVARHVEINMEKDDKEVVTALSWKWKEDAKDTNGVYCLRTNRQGVDEKQLWDLYNRIRDVEDAFRSMKSDLGLRPVRHHNEYRTDGHLFITVLAYHILHSIRFALRKKGIHDNWSTIRQKLSCHIRTTTTLKREDSKAIHIRKTSRPESYQKLIYQALGIAEVPGRTVKTEF
jgi:transposase